MSIESEKVATGSHESGEELTKLVPLSLRISNDGIATANEFARLMSALMSDVIAGRIDPQIAKATIAAGGKLLKVVEMKYKYGGSDPHSQNKVLRLLD